MSSDGRGFHRIADDLGVYEEAEVNAMLRAGTPLEFLERTIPKKPWEEDEVDLGMVDVEIHVARHDAFRKFLRERGDENPI